MLNQCEHRAQHSTVCGLVDVLTSKVEVLLQLLLHEELGLRLVRKRRLQQRRDEVDACAERRGVLAQA